MRDFVVSEDLLRAIVESAGGLQFVNARGEVLGRFEPELTPQEMDEIRRRLTSCETRYTTDEVLARLRSAAPS